MRELDLRAFMNLARAMEDQDIRFGMIETLNESNVEAGQLPTAKLDDDELKMLADRMKRMAMFAEQIGLTTSHNLLKWRENTPPKTQGEWQILISAIHSELKDKLVLYVPSDRARFIKMQFKPEVTAAFPLATKEMGHAARALAYGLFTASVFHSMRAGEIGVRALSDDLGVTLPIPLELVDWHTHQMKIAGKIAAIKGTPKTEQRDKDLGFYSQAAAQLQYFNDGWRVRVSHARASYEEGEQSRSSIMRTLCLRFWRRG